MQLWLPSLCSSCKPLFIRSAARSTDKALPVKDFCRECRAFLASKQTASSKPSSEQQKNLQQQQLSPRKEPVTATTVLKNKVLSEIESLIKPVVEVTPVKTATFSSSAPRPLLFMKTVEEAPKAAPQLPLSSELPIYEAFTAAGIDWCRYCGTTAGTSWRPGPWGPRSLCFRHGREYSFHKRLDLSAFVSEQERSFPVLQGFCKICWRDDGIVRRCHGCANGFHAQCYLKRTNKNVGCLLAKPWYCNATCPRHFESGSIRVAHSTKEPLPFQSGHCPDNFEAVDHDEEADSFSESCASEHLDVVTPVPSLLIRLKEPTRPPTPIPNATVVETKKRRVSCPAAASAKPTVLEPMRKHHKRTRSSSASVPDFLITVDHTVAIRRDERQKTEVLCPAYKVIPRPPHPSMAVSTGETVTEELYSRRHCRYEELEKTTRLLKPDILSTLFQCPQVA